MTDRDAILMNAFVFPGSGHLLAGQRAKGAALGLLTLIFLVLPIVRYTMTATAALARLSQLGSGIGSGVVALDRAWVADRTFILACLAGLFLCWLYGIVDLWLLARRTRGTP